MCLAVYGVRGDGAPFHKRRIVQVAQFISALQQSYQALVYLGFRNLSCFYRFGQRMVGVSAFHIGTGQNSMRDSIFLCLRKTVSVRTPEIIYCPTVACYQSLIPPFLSQNLL